MATYWTSFAATGNPNGDLSQFGGWPPHPSTARNCTTTQPHVVWPMFKVGSADAESAEYIMLNECNVTVQPAVSYGREQCEFWASEAVRGSSFGAGCCVRVQSDWAVPASTVAMFAVQCSVCIWF